MTSITFTVSWSAEDVRVPINSDHEFKITFIPQLGCRRSCKTVVPMRSQIPVLFSVTSSKTGNSRIGGADGIVGFRERQLPTFWVEVPLNSWLLLRYPVFQEEWKKEVKSDTLKSMHKNGDLAWCVCVWERKRSWKRKLKELPEAERERGNW